MQKIQAEARTVKELLKDAKYSIDYYQREYKWKTKQVLELLNDLILQFSEAFEEHHERKDVMKYPHYFLGSIIISQKEEINYIVDGQQRLTTLTILLILLKNLQNNLETKVNIDDLIYSEKFGEKSFNIQVDEWYDVFNALFYQKEFDINGYNESVRNIYYRYKDLEENFPDNLKGKALPYFIDWLLENVHLVEITTFSDEDAYTIFETMNDRGLSLTPTEMLKGFILSKINENQRKEANRFWRQRIEKLTELGKDVEYDFFKNWFRSQYAQKIRERRKNAKPEDFDIIGTKYHRWFRENIDKLKLKSSTDFYNFIKKDFNFYSLNYLKILKGAIGEIPEFTHIKYNADNGFTLQNLLLLAALSPSDDENTINRKLKIVSKFIDILITWRIWNFRNISYSTMQYTIFLIMKEIRRKTVEEIADILYNRLKNEPENFRKNSPYHRPNVGFFLHQQNRRYIKRILARLTDFVEVNSGLPSLYNNYVTELNKNRYEIEHILANNFELYSDIFDSETDFQEQRNRISGLLLLPKSFNASYGALPYKEKRKFYLEQNLLAKSLHPQAYEHNPGFISFIKKYNLPFKPYDVFDKNALNERYELYVRLAELIWNPESLKQI